MRWALVAIALGIVCAATPSQGQPACCACVIEGSDSAALFCVFVPDGDTGPAEQRCKDQGGGLLCALPAPAMSGAAGSDTISDGNCRDILAEETTCPNVPLGAPVLSHTWLAALAALLAAFATVRLARRRRWSP
jgi:hypothetical protein